MIITPKLLAQRLGWSQVRTKRWLQRTGAGRKRGSRWITTYEYLLAYWPEAAPVVEADRREHLKKVGVKAVCSEYERLVFYDPGRRG